VSCVRRRRPRTSGTIPRTSSIRALCRSDPVCVAGWPDRIGVSPRLQKVRPRGPRQLWLEVTRGPTTTHIATNRQRVPGHLQLRFLQPGLRIDRFCQHRLRLVIFLALSSLVLVKDALLG
jgi:hypothetical protein